MRYCDCLLISLDLLISLSLGTTRLGLGVINGGSKSFHRSLQSTAASGHSVVPLKEAHSRRIDRGDRPEKTKSVLHRRQISCNDKAEAKKLTGLDIVLVEEDSLLRCERDTCRHASAECITGRSDSGEVTHDDVGVSLVEGRIALQKVVDTAQGLEDDQFGFLQICDDFPIRA